MNQSLVRQLPGVAATDPRARPHATLSYSPTDWEIRERVFATSSGKARFTVHPLPQPALEPDQFLMMTIRSHDQYNTTVYGLEDREDECREAG